MAPSSSVTMDEFQERVFALLGDEATPDAFYTAIAEAADELFADGGQPWTADGDRTAGMLARALVNAGAGLYGEENEALESLALPIVGGLWAQYGPVALLGELRRRAQDALHGLADVAGTGDLPDVLFETAVSDADIVARHGAVASISSALTALSVCGYMQRGDAEHFGTGRFLSVNPAGSVVGDADGPFGKPDYGLLLAAAGIARDSDPALAAARALAAHASNKEAHLANPRITAGPNARYVPGDVATVRYRHGNGAAFFLNGLASTLDGEFRDGALHDGDGDVVTVYRSVEATASSLLVMHGAVPFFLDVAASDAILGSHAPDAALLAAARLPFEQVFVCFGAPMRFEAASAWIQPLRDWLEQWAPDAEGALSDSMAMLAGTGAGVPELDEATPEESSSVLKLLAEHGGTLHGIVLVADDDYQVADTALFLISTGDPAQPGKALSTIQAGSVRRGALAAVAQNAAAVVAWGSWSKPDARDPVNLNADAARVRDMVRRGKFRRTEAGGGPLGVHVIDLTQTNRGGPRDGEADDSRHVAPHLRRGHWRRARCGPRRDWHYEGRWIAPVFVNPERGMPTGTTVYRLPEPPEGTASQLGELDERT